MSNKRETAITVSTPKADSEPAASDSKKNRNTHESNTNKNKVKKSTPQWSRVGDFPSPIQACFDLLSPHPIPGIRIPLEKLCKEIHKMALGTSRLGPLTGSQIASDLKAPYATLTGNMLMMGVRIAFAQMEFARQQSFVFQRHEFLKSLREYFDLKELEILDFKLSSGRMTEPAKPGIPYSPEKYAPEQLKQVTSELSKLAESSREMLVTHQREWENFIQVNRPVAREMIKDMPCMQSLYASAADPNHPDHEESKQRIEKAERTFVERSAARSRPIPEKVDEEQITKIVGKQVFEVDPQWRKDLELKKKTIQDDLQKMTSSQESIDEKQKARLEKELKWVEKDLSKTNEQIIAEKKTVAGKQVKIVQTTELISIRAAVNDAQRTNSMQDPNGAPSVKAILEESTNMKKMKSEKDDSSLKSINSIYDSKSELVEKQQNQLSEFNSEMAKLQNLATDCEKNFESQNKNQS